MRVGSSTSWASVLVCLCTGMFKTFSDWLITMVGDIGKSQSLLHHTLQIIFVPGATGFIVHKKGLIVCGAQ